MAKPTRHRNKWRIRWLDHERRRRSEVYDNFREAEAALARHKAERDEILSGRRRPRPKPRRFNELCDYWLANRAVVKRSRKDDESIIRRHLREAFGNMELSSIGPEAACRYEADRTHLSPKTVANQLTLLISMLNLAVDMGWLDRAPRIRKPKIRPVSGGYAYLRTDDEIRRFLAAARAEGEHVFILYALAAYTGLRAGELAGLLWSDVDFARRLIVVQRSFDGPTKSGDVRYVPILDPLLPLLNRWKKLSDGDLVNPNQRGTMHKPSARIFQEVLKRVLERGGFPRIQRRGKDRGYITFHDLRHTFASHYVMNGGDIYRLQRILGHKSIKMTQRYAHLDPSLFVSDHSRFADWTQTQA